MGHDPHPGQPTNLNDLAASIGLGAPARAAQASPAPSAAPSFRSPREPRASRERGWWRRVPRRAWVLTFVALAVNVGRLVIELEHDPVSSGPSAAQQADEAAQDARDEAELQAALRDEEHDYGAANIRAQKRKLARLLEPGDRVVQVVVGGDGVLGVMLLGRPKSKFFFTEAPEEVGFFKTTRQFARARPIRVSDIDPEAPLRLVQQAERLSPEGTSMNIDRVLLRESPDHDGRLIWTLIPDEPEVPVTYYADRSARHVVTDRSKL